MDAFTALADPVRRDIVVLLRRGGCAAGAVAMAFPQISRPAVSRHLRVLREAGLVTVEPTGRERRYAADLEGLTAVETWLRALRAGDWEQRLDALETEVHRTMRDHPRQDVGTVSGRPTPRSSA